MSFWEFVELPRFFLVDFLVEFLDFSPEIVKGAAKIEFVHEFVVLFVLCWLEFKAGQVLFLAEIGKALDKVAKIVDARNSSGKPEGPCSLEPRLDQQRCRLTCSSSDRCSKQSRARRDALAMEGQDQVA